VNPTRSALVTALASDPAVTSKLSSSGAIYHRMAPASARTPYVLFSKQAGSRQNVFGGGGVTEEAWLVKAVDQNGSASRAEDIAIAINQTLDGTTLPLSNGLTAYLLHETDVDYGEMDGDQTIQHVGAIYRILDP
jgi:hypothetical protein